MGIGRRCWYSRCFVQVLVFRVPGGRIRVSVLRVSRWGRVVSASFSRFAFGVVIFGGRLREPALNLAQMLSGILEGVPSGLRKVDRGCVGQAPGQKLLASLCLSIALFKQTRASTVAFGALQTRTLYGCFWGFEGALEPPPGRRVQTWPKQPTGHRKAYV